MDQNESSSGEYDCHSNCACGPAALMSVDVAHWNGESVLDRADPAFDDQCVKGDGFMRLDEECGKTPRKEKRAIRQVIRKCTQKLAHKLAKSTTWLDRAAAFKAGSLLSQVWTSGLGQSMAVELVRDALAEQEEEARAIGINPGDSCAIHNALFPQRKDLVLCRCTTHLLDKSVLPLMLNCSSRILRRLKRLEPRWDRSAIRRSFRRLGQVWARGLACAGGN